MNLLLIMMVGSFSAWITWVVPRPLAGPLLMLAFALVYVGASVILYIHWRLGALIILPVGCAGFITNLSVMTYREGGTVGKETRQTSLFPIGLAGRGQRSARCPDL